MLLLIFVPQFHRPAYEISEYWIGLPLLAIFLVISWKYCRRFRRAIHQVESGVAPNLRAAYYPPSPWIDVANFTLEPAKLGIQHLQIKLDGGLDSRNPKAIYGKVIVDAEISCTDSQALQLNALLKNFIRRARQTTP